MIPGSVSPLLLSSQAAPFLFSATLVSLPSTANWNAMAYNHVSGNFCAVARGTTKGALSTDGGATFSATTLPSSSSWGQPAPDATGGWVVTDHEGSASAYGGNSVWTAGGSTAALTHFPIEATVNAGSRIVAVDGSFGASARVSISTPDGVTWTTRGSVPNAASNNAWGAMAGYSNPSSKLIVVNASGYYSISSNEGTSWSAAVAFSSGNSWQIGCNGDAGVASSPRFLAVRSGFNTTAASSDGASWTYGTLPTTGTWSQPVWCKNAWVVFSVGTNKCYTSPDAVTWTEQTLPAVVTAVGWGNYQIWPADVRGTRYRTVVPRYGSAQAILVKTTAAG